MAKTSEAKRNELALYAQKIGEDTILTVLACDCNSKAEIDAARHCIVIAEDMVSTYKYAISSAPANRKERSTQFQKDILQAKNKNEISEIKNYYDQISPLMSKVKNIKDEMISDWTYTLKSSGMGKKRINKIIPELIRYLDDDEIIRKTYPQ